MEDENRLPDVDGDNNFLWLLSRNNFEIGKTAKEMGRHRESIRGRLKGLCLKALTENNWDIPKAAGQIALDANNLEAVKTKVEEYYQNTLKELSNYDSLEQLEQQIKKKYKNTPRKFHPYILKMYKAKRRD